MSHSNSSSSNFSFYPGAKIQNVRLDSHFTTLSNRIPENTKLSWGAKGLLFYILTRESSFSIHTWHLARIYSGEKKGNGKDAVMGFLEELKREGYLVYVKYHGPGGKWCHSYTAYPMPFSDFQKLFPELAKPTLEKLALDNPAVLPNKELPSTELPNRTSKDVLIAPAEEVTKEPPPDPKPDKPGGANNKSLSLYKCLDQCVDLSDRQKRLLMKFSEPLVSKAVKYAYHSSTSITGGPIGRFKLLQYFLRQPEDFEETLKELDKPLPITSEQEVPNSGKQVSYGRFVKGERYNGFEFGCDDNGPYFVHPNGMTIYSVKRREADFKSKFLALMKKLGIEP